MTHEEQADHMIRDTFLHNEMGWREWYALTNAGQQVPPPNGMARRLRDRVATALQDTERRVWDDAVAILERAQAAQKETGT